MHAKKSRYLFLLLVLAAACLPQPTLRSELFLDDTSLITDEPCGAPCWNDITPGETSWEVAVESIRNDSRFAGLEINSEGEFVEAIWQKADSNQFCCRLVGKEAEDSIDFLFLALSPEIVVDEVLDAHGDPTYVVAQPFTDTESVVQLIYPDVPMIVWVLIGDTQSSLLANSEVVALLYMTAEQMALIIDTNTLQAWAGYQPYAVYEQATPAVTPRITLTPVPE